MKLNLYQNSHYLKIFPKKLDTFKTFLEEAYQENPTIFANPINNQSHEKIIFG